MDKVEHKLREDVNALQIDPMVQEYQRKKTHNAAMIAMAEKKNDWVLQLPKNALPVKPTPEWIQKPEPQLPPNSVRKQEQLDRIHALQEHKRQLLGGPPR
jgi:hypothetical protein